MFSILADIVFNFIKYKKQPFPSAMLSQEDFWNVSGWKRAIIFIFLYRIVTGNHVTKKYHAWTQEDFDLTRSLFNRSVTLTHINRMRLMCNSHAIFFTLCPNTYRWMKNDVQIMKKSKGLRTLDEVSIVTSGRRSRQVSFVPSSQAPPAKKVRYHVDLSIDSDSE